MTTYSETEILNKLDTSEFPSLGNMNVDYVRGRLELYRDERRWAMVFNWVIWAPAGDGPEAMIECFGNCINGREGLDDFNSRFSAVEFEYDDYKLAGVKIRGRAVRLPEGTPEEEGEFDALASLAEQHKKEMVASEAEVRKRIPTDLPKLLVLEDWYHPDWDEKPSGTETFQQLAKVLVTGDIKHYKPTREPNTDGRKWQPK